MNLFNALQDLLVALTAFVTLVIGGQKAQETVATPVIDTPTIEQATTTETPVVQATAAVQSTPDIEPVLRAALQAIASSTEQLEKAREEVVTHPPVQADPVQNETTVEVPPAPPAVINISALRKEIKGTVNLWQDQLVMEGRINIADAARVSFAIDGKDLGTPEQIGIGDFRMILDTTAYEDGEHTVMITATNKDGFVRTAEASITIKNNP